MSTSSASTSLPVPPAVELAPLLTMRQVAAILGISVSKAYTLVASGAIPSILIGDRSRRVEPKALQQYLATCATHPDVRTSTS